MLNLVPVYPSETEASADPWRGHLDKIARQRMRRFIIANDEAFHLEVGMKRCGVISVAGWAENFNLRDTPAANNAHYVDVLAVWFAGNVTFPRTDKLPGRGFSIVEGMADKEELYQTPMLVRNFITGIEQQMERRVILIGTNYLEAKKSDGLLSVEDQTFAALSTKHEMVEKFLVVPNNLYLRHQAPPVSDEDLQEVIRWLWDVFRLKGTDIPKLDDWKARQLVAVVMGTGLISSTQEQMLRCVKAVIASDRKSYEIATIKRLVPSFEQYTL